MELSEKGKQLLGPHKWWVLTKGTKGTTLAICPSEAIAVRLCKFAMESGCSFAFYAK